MTARAGAVALTLVCRLAAQAPDVARAFVEVEPLAASAYVHEPVELRVRVGVDADWFAAHALPLSQQKFARAFRLSVPWLRGADDRAVTALPPAAEPDGSVGTVETIAVGDALVPARRLPPRALDGRAFDVLELRYRWLPLAAGTATILPVELRYAWTTAFDDDFLRGRQPRDRRDQVVVSSRHELTVRALPREGRPAGFTGAVGTFVVRAQTTAARVAVGDTFQLDLTITGEGNLERIAPPAPPPLPGFHVQGVRERPLDDGRAFVLDVLALRAGLTAVPPIPFVAFAPAANAYVVHRTEPVPLAVGPLPAGRSLAPDVETLVRAEAARHAPSRWRGPLGLALVLAALLAFVGQRRRRRHGALRLQALLATLGTSEDAATVATAFAELCALRAGSLAFAGAATWHGLASAGVDAAVVARAQALHADLDAARFGGQLPPREEIVAVARAVAGGGTSMPA